jgi:outer membrane protein
LAFNAVQAQSHVVTLKESVETAIANNLTTNQAGFKADAAEVNLNQAVGNMIPRLGGSIEHYLNNGRSIDPSTNTYINQELTSATYSLTANGTLFNGFYLLNQLKSNKFAYAAAKEEWQQSKDKLTLDVMLAYLQMLNNTDLLDQSKRQSEVTRQQVERLETMNRNGAIKPSDLSDLRGQYANDQLALINTQNSLDLARYALAQLMNISYDKDLQAARIDADQFDLNYGNSADSIYQAALQMAIVKAADLRTKSYEKALSAAKGNLYPSLGIGAGFNTNYSSVFKDANGMKIGYGDQLKNNYGTYIGAGINIPILNNFRYRNQVRLARIDVKNASLVSQTTKTQLKQNVEKDYFNMLAALGRYKASIDQVAAYQESFLAAEVRFNEGVGSSVDYIIAKNNLDKAKTNLITARYEYLLRIKILDYYQSKPLW